MSFLFPATFLWLIPLAGAIILLYFLKMKRKELIVPASFLWPRLAQEIRANSLFQRPKVSLLLLLQLLAAILLLTALARPQVRSKSLSGQATVLVIDASASMAATDVKPSRLSAAVRIAQKFVAAARPGDQLGLIEAGPIPRVLFPLSEDPSRMGMALNSVQTYDAPGDVGEALRLAASLVSKSSSAKVVLLSDGVFGNVPNFSPGRAQLVFQKIGESGENAAVTALGISDTAGGSLLYCGLKNYGKSVSKGVLNIYADGQLANSLLVEIPAKGNLGKTLPAPSGAKVFEAKLDNGDDLVADNYAVCLRDSQALSVLLVGPGDLFLERALSLDPRVTLYKANTAPQTGSYDIAVFDGVPETRVNASSILSFGSVGPDSAVAVSGVTDKAQYKSEDSDDPILKGVQLDRLFVSKCQVAEARATASVLAEGSAGPWVVKQSNGRRRVYVAFSPLDSDFPLRVGFPIFIGNVLTYLVPKEASNMALSVPAARNIAFSSGSGALEVRRPDGAIESLKSTNGQFVLRHLDKVGRYLVQGKSPRPVYVTFASDSESNIAPVDKPSIGGAPVPSVNVVNRLIDWWKPFLAGVLLLLCAEWVIYVRRS